MEWDHVAEGSLTSAEFIPHCLSRNVAGTAFFGTCNQLCSSRCANVRHRDDWKSCKRLNSEISVTQPEGLHEIYREGSAAADFLEHSIFIDENSGHAAQRALRIYFRNPRIRRVRAEKIPQRIALLVYHIVAP